MPPSRLHRGVIFLSICVAVLAAVAVVVAMRPATSAEPTAAPLQIRLVEPAIESGVAAIGHPGLKATFSYELRNTGEHDLDNLSARLSCSCEAAGEFPKHIAAGETARVQFHFHFPDSGVSRIAIPILHGEAVVGIVEAALTASIVPPHFLSQPGSLRLTAIRGTAPGSIITFSTLERQDAPHWIQGLEFRPIGDLSAAIETVRDLPTVDPSVIRRTYSVRIDVAVPPRGTCDIQAEAWVQFSGDPTAADAKAGRFPVTISFKDAVALRPERVIFRQRGGNEQQSVRVRMVWRVTPAPLTIVSAPDWCAARFDEDADATGTAKDLVVTVNNEPAESLAGEIVLALQSHTDVQIRLPVQFVAELPQ